MLNDKDVTALYYADCWGAYFDQKSHDLSDLKKAGISFEERHGFFLFKHAGRLEASKKEIIEGWLNKHFQILSDGQCNLPPPSGEKLAVILSYRHPIDHQAIELVDRRQFAAIRAELDDSDAAFAILHDLSSSKIRTDDKIGQSGDLKVTGVFQKLVTWGGLQKDREKDPILDDYLNRQDSSSLSM